MQIPKKYFTEGLIQFTILLSLIGVRVDVDSYLNSFFTPLIESNQGPSSAYIQTPFHSLRDTLDGYSVHPKCPELDYFFASRRLLEEVRTLGSPSFPSQVNAWLVHQVSATDNSHPGQPLTSNNSTATSSGSQTVEHSVTDDQRHFPDNGQEDCHTDVKEEEPAVFNQLAQASTHEQENLCDGLSTALGAAPQAIDIEQQWSQLLSMPVADLDDLETLVSEHLPVPDADITRAISQDVSLHDAMITSSAGHRTPLFRSESTNGTYSEAPPDLALGMTALPSTSVYTLSRNMLAHPALSDCLDEAVFDQINQLGLEDFDTIDSQLMGTIHPQVFEDLESDSGLSLESSCEGQASPGISEMSSSSSSYCEEEGGATGYSSDLESLSCKGLLYDTTMWSTVDLSECVWHNHSYSSRAFIHQPSAAKFIPKHIKEEPPSDDESPKLEEREMSRDEMRARAMCIPFSALQIVNMPVDEFLEILDGHEFSPEQVMLLRDIRRRGKNKLAAQNCRKRKLDAITGLQDEVVQLQAQRDQMLREKQLTAKTLGAVGQQIEQLTRDVLARMRDPSGRPLNPERFTLQCGANGRVVVQPLRQPSVSTSASSKADKRKKDKKQ